MAKRIIPTFDDYAFEQEIAKLAETIEEPVNEEFTVVAIGAVGNEYHISINGHEYGYEPLKGTITDLERSFKGLLKHSAGKAITWLKKNANLVFGGKERNKMNFDNFINESAHSHKASSDKYVKMMNYVLEKNKERGAEEIHLYTIPTNWLVYDKAFPVQREDKAEPSRCYDNALAFAKKTDWPLCIGVFLKKSQVEQDYAWVEKDDINKVNPMFAMYPHAWNLTEDGEIYDVTIDNDLNDYVYVGHVVNPKKFNKGFFDLMNFLIDEIKIKK